MATFINASFLGVSQESQFLGEATARIRSIKTFTIEGFIDSRINSDLQGVKETILTINNLNKTLSGPLVSTKLIMEDIIINETNYGKGKVVSLDFKSSNDGKENQIMFGSYSATIEFFLAGDLSLVYGFNVPNPEFLENFSESFSFSLSEDSSYDYDHSLTIKYIEGTKQNNQTIDVFSTAKSLASNVFSQALAGFNGIIDGHFGDYTSLGKKYFTEKYDKLTGECSFSKKFNAFNKNGTTYSVSATNSFEINEDGVATVSETGTIKGRTSDALDSALDGLDEETASSFLRCQLIYNAYKNHFAPTSSSLKNLVISSSKSINNNTGDVEYSLSYTDDIAIESLQFSEDRTLKFDRNNISTVDETTTRTYFEDKSNSFLGSILAPAIASLVIDATARCLAFYLSLAPPRLGVLKIIKSSIDFSKFGNSYTYNVSFSDNDTLFSSGPFIEKNISVTDEDSKRSYEEVRIANRPRSLIHDSSQNNLATRSVKATVRLPRRPLENNFYYISQFKSQTAEAVLSLFNELKNKAYNVYVETSAPSLDFDIYISSLSYTINSDYTMTMNLGVSYSTT